MVISEEDRFVALQKVLVYSVTDLRRNSSEKAARTRVGGGGLCFGDLDDGRSRHLG